MLGMNLIHVGFLAAAAAVAIPILIHLLLRPRARQVSIGTLRFLRLAIKETKRRRRILSLVQDALGQLRLDMKYLAFDLEATRRERDEFRRKWEETL